MNESQRKMQVAYRSVNGAILYLFKSTQPDITFAINRHGRYASNPGEVHAREMKHSLR